MNYTAYIEMISRGNEEYIQNLSRFYSNFHWDFYCHLTFSRNYPDWKSEWKIAKYSKKEVNKISDEYIIQMWKKFRFWLNRELFGKKFMEKNLTLNWVIGIERGETTGNEHIHAIVGNEFGLDLNKLICRMCIKNMWEKIGLRTGIARIEKFDYGKFKTKGSIFYLCKHQIKKGNVRDWFSKRIYVYDNKIFIQGDNKQYFYKDDFVKYHPINVVLMGWTYDCFNKVWCKGICKEHNTMILRN